MDHDDLYEQAEQEYEQLFEEELQNLIEQFKQENGIEPNQLQTKELKQEVKRLVPSIDILVENLMSSMIDNAYDSYKDGLYE